MHQARPIESSANARPRSCFSLRSLCLKPALSALASSLSAKKLEAILAIGYLLRCYHKARPTLCRNVKVNARTSLVKRDHFESSNISVICFESGIDINRIKNTSNYLRTLHLRYNTRRKLLHRNIFAAKKKKRRK
ncbi:hypothetical protein PUN28_001536 [Cardiocondyla obscurior]|uniref:Ribosomal protein S13 n=1 Tax=Cardiocondyla obscurior TaxID=286306 RepID=A0AAW2H5L2_9HYME